MTLFKMEQTSNTAATTMMMSMVLPISPLPSVFSVDDNGVDGEIVVASGSQYGSQLMLRRRRLLQSGIQAPLDGVVPLPHWGDVTSDSRAVIVVF